MFGLASWITWSRDADGHAQHDEAQTLVSNIQEEVETMVQQDEEAIGLLDERARSVERATRHLILTTLAPRGGRRS